MNASQPRSGWLSQLLWYLPVLLILAFFTFPLIWIVMTALKPPIDVFAYPPKFVFAPTLDNYRRVLASDYMGSLANSVIIALTSAAFSVVLGTLTAYGFSRYPMRGKDNLFFWILSLRMLPVIAVIVPYFLLFQRIGLTDTLLAMILVYSVFNISFTVWLLKGFFDEVPFELEESAQVDGARWWQALRSITLPLALPGIIVTSMFAFVFSWNNAIFPLVLSNQSTATLPIGAMSYTATAGASWNFIAATAIVAMLPPMVIFLALGRYIVRGLTFGAVKG